MAMFNYKEMFDDILMSIGDDGDKTEEMMEILQAFELSIIDWMDYHENQVRKYKELHRRFLTGDYKNDVVTFDNPDVEPIAS